MVALADRRGQAARAATSSAAPNLSDTTWCRGYAITWCWDAPVTASRALRCGA